jgi:hypothetical protein
MKKTKKFNMEISEEEYNELKRCYQMLGQIGAYLEDFCGEDETTLEGVMKMLARYHSMRAHEIYVNLDKMKFSD